MPSSQRILVNKFLVRHKYSMIVNDDDYYHSQFIKEFLNVLKIKILIWFIAYTKQKNYTIHLHIISLFLSQNLIMIINSCYSVS